MPCYEVRTISLDISNFDINVLILGMSRLGYVLQPLGRGVYEVKRGTNCLGRVNSAGVFTPYYEVRDDPIVNKMKQAYSVGIVAMSASASGLTFESQEEEEGVITMTVNTGRPGL
jgi:hypothetical protein